MDIFSDQEKFELAILRDISAQGWIREFELALILKIMPCQLRWGIAELEKKGLILRLKMQHDAGFFCQLTKRGARKMGAVAVNKLDVPITWRHDCLAIQAGIYLAEKFGKEFTSNAGRAQKPSATFFGENVAWGKNYSHLSIEERTVIQTQLGMGFKPAQIARELGRSPATLNRELKRNGWVRPGKRRVGRPLMAGGYRAIKAQDRADVCAARPRVKRKLMPGTALWPAMLGYLQAGYSPEQIAGTLKSVHPDTHDLQVSHETIYSAIYAMPRGELRSEVIGWLRFGHAKRRPRTRGDDRRGQIPDMVSIHDRPPEVEERLVPGHWEGDLIKGARNQSAVGTLVERTSLYTVLAKMENAGAEAAVKGFSHVLDRIEAQKRLSLTYDQGKEMSKHQVLTEKTGIKVYFADPHSPWQRGINENTNGLLRQYLPKGTDLSVFSQDDLDAIAWTLNTRPRKSLGFKCPAQLFTPDAFDFRRHHAALFALGT